MSLFLKRWSKLYSAPTRPELALEPALAALGLVYRAQHPVFALGVIPDFAVFPHGDPTQPGWIIEVDGKEHRTPAGLKKDAERTKKLEALGWRVLRFTNEETLADPVAVAARIREAINE